MLGAIIGDIVGSRFEFIENKRSKDFTLFTEICKPTDDSFMTLAIAKALILAKNDKNKLKEIFEEVVEAFNDIKEDVSEEIEEFKEDVKETVEEFKEEVIEEINEVAEEIDDKIEEMQEEVDAIDAETENGATSLDDDEPKKKKGFFGRLFK